MLPEYKIAIHLLSKNMLDENSELKDKKEHAKVKILLRALKNLMKVTKSSIITRIIARLDIIEQACKGSKSAIVQVNSKRKRKFREVNQLIKRLISSLKNPIRSPIKLLFSDIDNTLIHKSFIRKLLPVVGEDRIISKRAISLLAEIGAEGIPVVLVSGRRISSFRRVMSVIPHSFVVLEHGCLILDRTEIDTRYAARFRKYIGNPYNPRTKGVLWEYEKVLQNKGYKTDSKGRIASFRIDPGTNNLSSKERRALMEMKHPYGIKIVRNLNFIDFIPPTGGKDNAIAYMLNKFGTSWRQVACMGDDYNDISMLSKARYTFTHASALSQVKRLVKSKKGYVSPYSAHNGTVDILKQVLGVIHG
jgi:HAD superfamily hydrolase (TIGR01484 family)